MQIPTDPTNNMIQSNICLEKPQTQILKSDNLPKIDEVGKEPQILKVEVEEFISLLKKRNKVLKKASKYEKST